MRKPVFICLLFLLSGTLTEAQSMLDNPFFYLYEGKRANEFNSKKSMVYANYIFPKLITDWPFKSVVLNDNFISQNYLLGGTGSFSDYFIGYNEKKIYSITGSDLSTVNGGLFGVTLNSKNQLMVHGVSRIQHNKIDRNNDHLLDQPTVNDLAGTLKYKYYNNSNTLEAGISRFALNSRMGPDSLNDNNNISTSPFCFANKATLTEAFFSSRHYLRTKKTQNWNQTLNVDARGYLINQESQFSIHQFKSTQRGAIVNANYRYNGEYSKLHNWNIETGIEYRYLDAKENMDGISLLPWKSPFGAYGNLLFRLSNKLRIDAVYRTDISTSFRFLHNPGIRLICGFKKDLALSAYTQIVHRYVDLIPEYLYYLSSDQNIYVAHESMPDELTRSGLTFSRANGKLSFKLDYHYDFYLLRNVADVYSVENTTCLYRLQRSSEDHTAEMQVGLFETAGRIHGRVTCRYQNSTFYLNNDKKTNPFISPFSAMVSVWYKNVYNQNEIQGWITGIYTSPFLLHMANENTAVYTKPVYALNCGMLLPFRFFIKHEYRGINRFLMRFTFTAGSENILNSVQTNAYSNASTGDAVNGVNSFGQYYGRRFNFGLTMNLAKNPFNYY